MNLDDLLDTQAFAARHIGPDANDERAMLAFLGLATREALIHEALPAAIRQATPLQLPAPRTESEALAELRALAARNQLWRTYIGMGYCGTHTPPVIQRNVLENPGWYTPYTPYQAEISQGRLEALLAFQQMLIDLTGLPVANASLLDEATAAGEAMGLIQRATKNTQKAFFVDAACHPQVVAVIRTRARWLGIPLIVGDAASELDAARVFGAHLQYPDTHGRISDPTPLIERIHAAGGLVSLGVDPLALVLLKSPGALGADVAIGLAQRFGVPLGYGGPHPGFLATRAQFLRQMPGRIVGVTRDAIGRTAFRMALQTREQHIRREKATSNICTSQVLLANVAGLYAVWHGPEGLLRIALRTHLMARTLAAAIHPQYLAYFDTLTLRVDTLAVRKRAAEKHINLRYLDGARVGVTLDETTDISDLAWVLTGAPLDAAARARELPTGPEAIPLALRRTGDTLTHPVFHNHRSETAMMRYLKRLESRDYSLAQGMIPLGSCTMKLNAAAEMAPMSWPAFANLHPFVPLEQAAGYHAMLADVAAGLEAITGLPHMTLQPNSGANGEYAGLVAIRNYQAARGGAHRDVCLIPFSAHGTNPASAHMAGLQVVVVACDAHGNVDVADLASKIAQYGPRICALMLTYPSTHGVFEEAVKEICEQVHAAGGQVYLDGANLNALAGLSRVADFGADVCHINLHKTFCIPHGGGGPGMGPIAVAPHLAPFLPAHPMVNAEGLCEANSSNGTVSASPWGSPLIVTISWMYLRMMGAAGIRHATETAILSANYVAARLKNHWPVLYSGARGRNAHECIFDLRTLKGRCGVTAEDVAKRLMDYGFHAPTLAFPVHETLMFEPTESEPKAELDRFCEAMIAIHGEIEKIATGMWPLDDNPLHNAPHTAEEIAGEWRHAYTREEAVYPLPALRIHKYWPPVKRVDQVFGDTHFFCGCPEPDNA